MEQIREAIKLAKSRQPGTAAAPSVRVAEAQTRTEPSRRRDLLDAGLKTYTVSLNLLEHNRIVAHYADHPLSAPFDILRTKLLQEMDKNNWISLAITSPTPGCGKTVTSINLALSIARLPERPVVLLDLDLRKPAIAKYFGVTQEKDLASYLRGEAELSEITFHVDIGGNRLHVIGNNTAIRNPAEAMSGQHMAKLLNEIKMIPGKPLIIIDTSPILVADDVLVLLPLVDCSLLTLAESSTTAREIEKSEELLANFNFLGCVLNKSKEHHDTHYY